MMPQFTGLFSRSNDYEPRRVRGNYELRGTNIEGRFWFTDSWQYYQQVALLSPMATNSGTIDIEGLGVVLVDLVYNDTIALRDRCFGFNGVVRDIRPSPLVKPDPFEEFPLLVACDAVEEAGMGEQAEQLRTLVRNEKARRELAVRQERYERLWRSSQWDGRWPTGPFRQAAPDFTPIADEIASRRHEMDLIRYDMLSRDQTVRLTLPASTFILPDNMRDTPASSPAPQPPPSPDDTPTTPHTEHIPPAVG